MSYILDALRRADAERQRGQVPGLHAQALSLPDPRRRRPGLGWVLGLIGLLLVLGAGGWWLAGGSQADRPPSGPAAGTTPAPADAGRVAAADLTPPTRPVPAPAPASLPAEPPTVPAAPIPTELAAALPPVMPRVVSAPRVLPAPQPAATDAPPAAGPAPLLAAAPAAVSQPQPQPAPSPAPARVLRLAELNAEQRRGLPPLAVGGSVWSDSAASRFVVLDGQVLREGDTVAPGLVLEALEPRRARLRWQGLRLELPL